MTTARKHLETAISQLDMFLPASYENILALSVGTACAVEMCKPSLAWVLVSNAAARCQDLGYHRFKTMKNDSEEQQRSKIHLFWMVYMFNKQLSLRLGRASQIQDWDLSLPLLVTKGASINGFEGSRMLLYWAKVARVQGQIYEKLYSPDAFTKTPSKRRRIAVTLINALHQAWRERDGTNVLSTSSLSNPSETEVPSNREQRSYEGPENSKSKSYMQGINDQNSVLARRAHAVRLVRPYRRCFLPYRRSSPLLNLCAYTTSDSLTREYFQPRLPSLLSSCTSSAYAMQFSIQYQRERGTLGGLYPLVRSAGM